MLALLLVPLSIAVAASLALSDRPKVSLLPQVFTNPIAPERADPHVHRHTDGFYYFTATVPEYDRLVISRAPTLQGLATATETVIWEKHPTGEMGAHIWAPELHYINEKWYIHFAAGRAEDIWAIRPYVLECAAANPIDGPWVERGQLRPLRSSFSLDATSFEHDGVRYTAWAEYAGDDSNIYLARQGTEPWVYVGEPVLISTPTYDWEIRGYRVNEGPSVIVRNGRVFMTFSASATDANYAIGLLTADSSSDLLNASSWVKTADPLMVSDERTQQFGPGHSCFTEAEDGTDVIVYHARPVERYLGNGYDPLYDPNRATRIQRVYWNPDGTPNFGVPLADGATSLRFSPVDSPDAYMRHWEFRVRLEAAVLMIEDTQFRVVPSLAGGPDDVAISLESANYPGYFLRHKGDELWLDAAPEGNPSEDHTFAESAAFFARGGLADGDAISFESVSLPRHFIRHRDGLFYVETVSQSEYGSATFAAS